MGKKETKIILDQSDDQCVVELEPLNPDQVCFVLFKYFLKRAAKRRHYLVGKRGSTAK